MKEAAGTEAVGLTPRRHPRSTAFERPRMICDQHTGGGVERAARGGGVERAARGGGVERAARGGGVERAARGGARGEGNLERQIWKGALGERFCHCSCAAM